MQASRKLSLTLAALALVGVFTFANPNQKLAHASSCYSAHWATVNDQYGAVAASKQASNSYLNPGYGTVTETVTITATLQGLYDVNNVFCYRMRPVLSMSYYCDSHNGTAILCNDWGTAYTWIPYESTSGTWYSGSNAPGYSTTGDGVKITTLYGPSESAICGAAGAQFQDGYYYEVGTRNACD